MVKNKLNSIAEKYREHLLRNVPKICACLSNVSDIPEDVLKHVRHPHTPKWEEDDSIGHSFTVVRLLLVSILAELSIHHTVHDPEQDDAATAEATEDKVDVFGAITNETYSIFVDWFFEFPENNLYSHQFYKFFFQSLRKNNVHSQTLMIQKNKFISRILEAFKIRKGDDDDGEEKKECIVTNRDYNTGEFFFHFCC